MKKIWEVCPNLTRIACRVHVGMELKAHNWDHTFRVAQHALNIAEDNETGRLAGAAGLCHGVDRYLEFRQKVGPATTSVSKIPWEESMLKSRSATRAAVTSLIWTARTAPSSVTGEAGGKSAKRLSVSMTPFVSVTTLRRLPSCLPCGERGLQCDRAPSPESHPNP